jgi:hypothetical protein
MPTETPIPSQEYPDTFQNISFTCSGASGDDYTVLYADRDMVIDRIDVFADEGSVTVAVGQDTDPSVFDGNTTNIVGAHDSGVAAGLDLAMSNNVIGEGNYLLVTVLGATHRVTFNFKIRTRRK